MKKLELVPLSETAYSVENTPLLTQSDKAVRNCTNDPSSSVLLRGSPTVPQDNSTTIAKCNWKKYGNAVFILCGIAAITSVVTVAAVTSGKDVLQQSSNILSASEGEDTGRTELVDVLQIPHGKLKWYILKSREGRNYYAFYKVPYAKPPTGSLRFKSPEAAETWEGIRDFKEVAPQCIQKSKYSPIVEAVGEEDCLYMNIYTPKINGESGQVFPLMPTLFYIHGGGFTDGNGSRYGGKYFMDEDVVLITFQYRLGPFGFLSTGDEDVSGNMGFKDQVMALKWVQENIKYFGGDPNRVMIFGNSAGGFSVSNLMVSPMAKGLFQTAITQSGGALCTKMTINAEEAEKTLNSLADEVGCSSRSRSRLVRCLRKQDAKDLAVVRTPDITYALTVENYDESDPTDVFMPDTIYNMLEKGQVNRVTWIVGVNSAEFLGTALGYLKDPEIIEGLNLNFTTTAPDLFDYDGQSSDDISKKAKEFYFNGEIIGNETISNLTNIVSDRTMVHCSKVQAVIQAKYSDVYLYYLSKAPAKSYADKAKAGFPPGDYGVSHADELQFLFPYYGYPEYPIESEYFQFSRLLVKTWVDFAATGKPYSANGVDWEKITPDVNPLPYFELNENPRPTTILQSRIEFWDQFPHEDLHYSN